MPKTSTALFQKMDELSDYLINRDHPEQEIELFYGFCYNILMKARNRDDSTNIDLCNQLLEEDLMTINLAFHGMVFGND